RLAAGPSRIELKHGIETLVALEITPGAGFIEHVELDDPRGSVPLAQQPPEVAQSPARCMQLHDFVVRKHDCPIVDAHSLPAEERSGRARFQSIRGPVQDSAQDDLRGVMYEVRRNRDFLLK